MSHRRARIMLSPFPGLVLLVALAFLAGCSSDAPLPTQSANRLVPSGAAPSPPAGLAAVQVAGQDLSIWGYTGSDFETPSDPIQFVFYGNADPIAIRAALLALDGDRSSLGLPPVYPFNALWSDAIGDVQTGYADGSGWTGSVVQVQLGTYDPMRIHLRLFGTGLSDGNGGTITLGAAHLDLLIPGTADHQVLSWMIPRSVVMGDLLRTGLVDPASVMPVGPVSAAPSFRDIPASIYNLLPDELKALIGGPMGPVSEPVPLASDGMAMAMHVVGMPELPTGTLTDELHFTYDQIIPRPFCNAGPLDWVRVEGPITFTRTTYVTPTSYAYDSHYQGQLRVTPVDVTMSPPMEMGGALRATVGGNQNGTIDAYGFLVQAQDRRIAPQRGGSEALATRLRVASEGLNTFTVRSRCLTAD
jgi:hypothetical protein